MDGVFTVGVPGAGPPPAAAVHTSLTPSQVYRTPVGARKVSPGVGLAGKSKIAIFFQLI
jgi:hypothetical protein